jgi:hypothetical protein
MLDMKVMHVYTRITGLLLSYVMGRAIVQAVGHPRRPGFFSRSGHLGFVGDEWRWGFMVSILTALLSNNSK